MAIQRIPIQDFLEQSGGALILDVRSPAEYEHAHMPGATSFPLFSNEERKVVGTTYKQESREQAIKVGLEYFGPKMRSMVEKVEELLEKNTMKATTSGQNGSPNAAQKSSPPTVYIYCWRGGMRSGAVSWLLDLYGFRVFVLAGGYKAYRNHVLQSFTRPYSFKILGGYTGSGKTEVLTELQRLGAPVIDLEGIACHKGSAFGGYGMPKQPGQEMFENLLSEALIRKKTEAGQQPIWLEDESQRIGNLNLPAALWENIRASPIIFLDIPFEERLNHIVEEYGKYPRENLVESIQRITKRLGGQHAKHAIECLESGNIKEAFRVLLDYYDKRYLKGLHNREGLDALLTTVACEKVSTSNAQLLIKYQSV